MKNPFEKREVKIMISQKELSILLNLIRSTVPSHVEEGDIVDIHDILNEQYEKMRLEK